MNAALAARRTLGARTGNCRFYKIIIILQLILWQTQLSLVREDAAFPPTQPDKDPSRSHLYHMLQEVPVSRCMHLPINNKLLIVRR